MFVGHYAAAIAAKTVEPRAPLWSCVAGCQLLDIGWSGLVMTGVEKFRIDPALPGSPLDLYFMPYTHSLFGAAVWSLATIPVAKILLRILGPAASMLGLIVFSHWVLDLIVHRPDLELGFGAGRVGLGLWNFPIPEMAVEMGLVAVAGAAWVVRRKSQGLKGSPAVFLIGFLALVQIIVSLATAGAGATPLSMGASALAIYVVVSVVAWFVDGGAPDRAELKAGAAFTS